MLNGLTDVLSKINSNKKTAINVGGVLQQAREAKREYFSKNIRENSNQYLRYFDELESKKDNFYVEGFSHIFGEAGNTEYKHLMGNLKGIVEASPYSFRVMPKGKEDFKRAFSLQDAIESTIPSNVKDAERQKAYQTAYAGLKVTAITYDLDNGVVIDYMVNGEKFEVRPNAEQITTLLSTRGASPRNLDKFKQITSTLKENNNTMGYIGEPNRKSRQTQFFVQQKDDATGIKKGQYYIYENGNKKAFASVQELMDWHTKNKEENYRAFEKAGTMLAMNPVEFAQAYPNVDRKELEIYMTKLFADDVKNSQLAIVAARAGHDVDDLEVVKVTDDKDKIVMKRPEDPNKTVDDKHVDVVDGKRLVRYEPLKSTKGMVELTPNDPTVLIGPFRELVEELGAKWADSGNAPFGITNSLRDIQQQEKLYANDPTYTKGTVSPHMEGMAVDIRVKDNAGIALVAWFKGEDGKKWLKDNNLAVLVHKVPGNADHIHLQYNKKLGTSNVLSYLFKDERDGTIITK
jgi:hypothetical protein